MKSFYLLFLLSFSCCRAGWCQIPAFPGAEGFGASTPGGRGGQVIKVTNLNDHGTGSLRAAIESEGPRIIVFEIGGVINLETELSVRNPFITIAGQTAPGDGICLRGECLRIYAHDVVVRYIRSRPGDVDFGPPNTWETIDAMSVQGYAYNVIIDHCSLSWAVDENIDVWKRAHDVTIQHCIIAESLKHSRHPGGAHGMGMIIGSNATNVSVHHNIFAHNNDRNPHINGKSFVDFRNNLIYNPGGRATDVGANRNQALNYVSNHVMAGPNTKIPADVLVRNLGESTPALFIQGNMGVNRVFSKLYYYDNAFTLTLDVRDAKDSAIVSQVERSTARPAPTVTTIPAQQLLSYLTGEVGATLPRRDAVDREVIRDVQHRGHGMVNNKNSLLAWPPYEAGITFIDSDDDGMPDHWEEIYGLNLLSNDNFLDIDNDGYTNIEEYLNNTDPNHTGTASSLRISAQSNAASDGYFPNLGFKIDQYYPNPFRDHINIKFSIDQPGPVTIKVYNTYGKEINELVNSFLYEGKYEIIWESVKASPGVYHIVMASEDHIESAKIVLVP